jgi:hypothetical protein
MAKAGTDYQTIADKYERSLLAIQWKVYKAVMVQSGAYEAMTEPSAEIEGDKAVEVPELVQEFLRAYHLPVEVFNDISETERRREAESERIQLAKSMLRKRTPKGKEDQEPGEQVTETKTSKRRRNRKNRGLRGIVTGESVKNMSESTLRHRLLGIRTGSSKCEARRRRRTYEYTHHPSGERQKRSLELHRLIPQHVHLITYNMSRTRYIYHPKK